MSYKIIHNILGFTLDDGKYVNQAKKLLENVKTDLTANGISVAETINPVDDTNYYYDVTWVLNSRYKIRFRLSGSTLYYYAYCGLTSDKNTYSSISMASTDYTKFTHYYSIYIGDNSLAFFVSSTYGNGNSVGIGWVKDVGWFYITTATDVDNNTEWLCYTAGSNTVNYYQLLAEGKNLPDSWQTEGGSKSIWAADGSTLDDYDLTTWLIPYTLNDSAVCDSYYKGKNAGYFTEIVDANGNLYVTYGGKWLKI